MENLIIEAIPSIKGAATIRKIKKGFSSDEKYIIDYRCLLRIFPKNNISKRKEEFDTIHQLSQFSEAVPKALEFGLLKDKAYMLLTYLPGKDAEAELKHLNLKDQYLSGFEAGIELKKMHKLPAPSKYPAWSTVKKKKSDRYLFQLENIDIDRKLKDKLFTYIRKNEHLMEGRQNTFQHDDFHPSNILIINKRFRGIIDFQRMDWGDPVHDLQKLGFFSKQISEEFTKGIIDGYHKNRKPDEEFWSLFTLYSAMHIVSALVWGQKGSHVQKELFRERSLEVMADHENFNSLIPNWYQ
ncbi:aminoglycoside phosphotransferase family protein [Halobacillus massiliensis]|uniref:aminoglycoside phosphotransferase family protein n=1 Tax=Halobacillus massiliensis TaxID=1926286 RepID=UPI0009E4678A|nr:aminoglycoside phosphotransferase family protein [Halobacillus massiliensis]